MRFISLALLMLATHSLANEQESEAIRVMLQGSSAADMRALVEKHGGSITHDLPIIDAVGAKVTRPALKEILKSPKVQRHLDDLSIGDIPPEDSEASECDVGGAVELTKTASGIEWTLFNKKQKPAQLETLLISWPAIAGEIKGLSLNQHALPVEKGRTNAANTVELKLAPDSPVTVATTGVIQAIFSTPEHIPADTGTIQSAFTLKATFKGDCSAELVPAYHSNAEDTYYPTVVGAAALHTHGIRGSGITVAIIDSGLWEHRALTTDSHGKDRVLARYNAIDDVAGKEVFDESGHGTHMASVLAHSGEVTVNKQPTNSFKGIAPDVNLVAIKAFNNEGQGDFLDIVRAVQFAVEHRETYNIKVLNLSFAARPRWEYWLDPINQAIMRAWASGITVVAAAGNEGPDAMTIGSPGNLPYVITVGAVTDSWTPDNRDDDYIPDFSSRGPTPDAHIKPDIVAPGGHMTGLTRPGSTLSQEFPEYFLRSGEFVMTGSSQAAALVSGIAALLLQLEPDLTPDDLKCKITSSAELAINHDGKLAYSPFQQGGGYVSATRAVTLGERGCGNTGLDIQKDINGIEHSYGPAIIDEEGSTSLPGLELMLSPESPEKGRSDTRKWGVKAHIERDGYQWRGPAQPEQTPFDWEAVYLHEKSRMEEIANTPRESE